MSRACPWFAIRPGRRSSAGTSSRNALGGEGGRETYRARVRGLAGFDRIFAVKCLRRRPGVAISRTDPFITSGKTHRDRHRCSRGARARRGRHRRRGHRGDRVHSWARPRALPRMGAGLRRAGHRRTMMPRRGGRSSWPTSAAEIAGALAAMHALAPPLVHGGLSPRNVIVTTRGGIKVLDVGLGAAALKGGDALSQRALAYAAPSSPGVEPTAPSDVRALGAMLFELATGELPAAGRRPAPAARRMLETAVASPWPNSSPACSRKIRPCARAPPRPPKILASHWADIPGCLDGFRDGVARCATSPPSSRMHRRPTGCPLPAIESARPKDSAFLLGHPVHAAAGPAPVSSAPPRASSSLPTRPPG